MTDYGPSEEMIAAGFDGTSVLLSVGGIQRRTIVDLGATVSVVIEAKAGEFIPIGDTNADGDFVGLVAETVAGNELSIVGYKFLDLCSGHCGNFKSKVYIVGNHTPMGHGGEMIIGAPLFKEFENMLEFHEEFSACFL